MNRIDNRNSGGVDPSQLRGVDDLQRLGGRRGAGRSDASLSYGFDNVEVSDLAKSVSRITAQSSVTRAARVEELAQLYRDGKYSVDSASLGRKLVEQMINSAREKAVE